jgi:dimethylglycine dehydrogenase
VGAYEKNPRFWAEEGTPQGFGHELFADDLERIEDNMMRAIARVPAVGTAGIKRVINGPMIWSPDSNVLFGPVPELRNYFCCNGIIPGFSQSGGMGLLAADWIVTGETRFDMFAWDLARFGDWADKAFTKARVGDQYANRFKIHFPHEERSAGRPARVRPVYEMQRELGAVFGLNYGWEHPLYFGDEIGAQDQTHGFTRQPWWDVVGAECRMLRETGGIIDISNFAKYRCKGAGAEDWLNAVFANTMPRGVGRSCLTPLIGKRGGIAGDFTVTRLSADEFWIIGSGMAERYHQRFFRAVPLPEGTTFESRTEAFCGFNVAGPRSRAMLQGLTKTSLATADFPFMRSKWIEISGVRCLALRVSFTGDLGWELHCAQEDQASLYAALLAAGREIDAGPVGSRALMSLRIEKGYGSWGREYGPEYWPQEVGLARLCKTDKPFLNREAVTETLANAARERLVILALDGKQTQTSNADASGGEPVFRDGVGIGRVTSGAYGYSVGMSLALAFVRDVVPGETVDVMVLGRPHKATVLAEPPFDPAGARLRA